MQHNPTNYIPGTTHHFVEHYQAPIYILESILLWFGNWEWGIGHGALGMGHWALDIKYYSFKFIYLICY
jgi:hypothetical protein